MFGVFLEVCEAQKDLVKNAYRSGGISNIIFHLLSWRAPFIKIEFYMRYFILTEKKKRPKKITQEKKPVFPIWLKDYDKPLFLHFSSGT